MVVMAAALALAGATAPASGASEVVSSATINPGGGVAADGHDGARFQVDVNGADQVHFAGASQYCCSAGAPMLSIGGVLFGRGGPGLHGGQPWDAARVVSTTGSAATADGTGSGAMVVEYSAEKGGLVYEMRREVTYLAGNSYVTDDYTFTIPAGNTDVVKFYLGGDTAPGGSDSGTGVMLTEPVRSVLSLNPYTGVYFGFREVPGSVPFDGARAASFYTPYPTVSAGGDIGFEEERAEHDAGLMMQWTLGSEPGVHRGAVRQDVGFQGVTVRSQLDRPTMAAGSVANLYLDVENTLLTPVPGVGLTLTLPAGVTVAGAPTTSCGIAVDATSGGTTVVIAGAEIAAGAGCYVSVPVIAPIGTYTLDRSNLSGLAGGAKATYDTTTITVLPVAPSSSRVTAPELRLGEVVDTVLDFGGTPAPVVTVASGRLPAGLTLGSDGRLYGTPTEAGTFRVTITATNTGGTETVELTLLVPAAPKPTPEPAPAPKPTPPPAPKPTPPPAPKPAPAAKPSPKKVVVSSRPVAGKSQGAAFVAPGQRVKVTARGMQANEKFTVKVAGKVVAKGRANARGEVSLTFKAPKVKSQGVRKVVVRGSSSGAVGYSKVTLAPKKKLKVSVRTPVRASDGQRVVVRGLLPREDVTVSYLGKVLAQGKADSQGRFVAKFTVGQAWGTMTVTAKGANANRSGKATFDIVQRCFVTPRVCA